MKTPFNLAGKYNVLAGIILGGLGLFLALLFLLVLPAQHGLKGINAELPKARAQNVQAKADKEALTKIKDFFNNRDHQGDIDRVSTAVPTQPSVPGILVILESLSKSHGVDLTSFSPQQVASTGGSPPGSPSIPGAAAGATSGGPNSIDVTANYSGQYSDLISFFYDLERSLRIVDVKTISVTAGKANAIEGTISFRAYYKPPEDAAATTGGTP